MYVCGLCANCATCLLSLQLSALVLSKLLSSLPTMRRHLRAGYLLGDTRSDKTGSLTMNNKVQQQQHMPGSVSMRRLRYQPACMCSPLQCSSAEQTAGRHMRLLARCDTEAVPTRRNQPHTPSHVSICQEAYCLVVRVGLVSSA